ncbi:Catalase-peroxidase [Trichinella spiralis]|uniref:Catalase-peroxidase n=1 Tax=Trichinella spiralis TaxID=6334 RepID=A0ABR3L1A1_TRISP
MELLKNAKNPNQLLLSLVGLIRDDSDRIALFKNLHTQLSFCLGNGARRNGRQILSRIKFETPSYNWTGKTKRAENKHEASSGIEDRHNGQQPTGRIEYIKQMFNRPNNHCFSDFIRR